MSLLFFLPVELSRENILQFLALVDFDRVRLQVFKRNGPDEVLCLSFRLVDANVKGDAKCYSAAVGTAKERVHTGRRQHGGVGTQCGDIRSSGPRLNGFLRRNFAGIAKRRVFHGARGSYRCIVVGALISAGRRSNNLY